MSLPCCVALHKACWVDKEVVGLELGDVVDGVVSGKMLEVIGLVFVVIDLVEDEQVTFPSFKMTEIQSK